MSLIAQAREGAAAEWSSPARKASARAGSCATSCLRAQLDGARVFSGRCPVNRKTIYAPFFDIFRQLVTAVNPDADAGEEIRRILRPSSRRRANRAPKRGQKYRLYNRIVQSMQDIYGFLSAGSETSGSPLILVIEDLQWADPSTADLFSFLVGEAKQNQLLVIGTLTLELEDSGSDETARVLGAAREGRRASRSSASSR